MAKRSPILGYNHNVRYRGLVFHVQTEDSGQLSPHLFTHLFYGGVIISTRKLVYDAGSDEGAIKSLMQAQHKAVMKDLKRGHFDDKIDLYLAGTEGLLPRGTADDAKGEPDPPRLAKPSQPIPAVVDTPPPATPPAEPAVSNKPTEQNVAGPRLRRDSTDLPMGLKPTKLDVAEHLPRAPALPRTITPTRGSPPRTKTADRTSAPTTVRTSGGVTDLATAPPPGSVAEAIQGATTKVAMQHDFSDDDSSPEIEIRLDLEDDSVVRRSPDLDDETRRTLSDGIPGAMASTGSSSARTAGESIPPLPPPPQSDRKVSLGAASLPPARPISRPPSRPAITPPQVVSRPASDERGRPESDAVEVYAPAPPSAEPPPGAAGERPGQYSQHSRRPLQRSASEPIPTVGKSGAIPAGLGRPGRSPSQGASRDSSSPIPVRDVGSGGQRSRPPTPTRVNPSPSRPSSNNSGVVMTRPAVIVGAPAKPQTTTQRVRKAREEEGRGFGQGLISEKSLDEVILAYLSEDADDK